MKLGSLKHRIDVVRLSTVINENGFESKSFEVVNTLWAAVKNLHGKEYFEAARINKEKTVKFLIRYTEGLDETMQIRFKEQTYNIESIDHIRYEGKWMEIKAIEVSNSS